MRYVADVAGVPAGGAKITHLGDERERKAARLAALEYLDAVRPEADGVLQELVDELRGAFGVELCMVTLVLSDVQYFRVWSGTLPPNLVETRRDPLERSICRYVVGSEASLVVHDFEETEEFGDQNFCVDYGMRFYAGTPLTTTDGHTIGALCLLDSRPTQFGKEDLTLLRSFARSVVGRLEVLGALGRERAVREELEKLGHRNRLILDSAGEGIYGLDLDGKTTFVNPAAARMTGWSVEELLGKYQHEVTHHTNPDGTPHRVEDCSIHHTLTRGNACHVSGEIFWRKDGTSFPVEYVSTPIRDRGEVVGTVVIFEDVTERRKAERVAKESEERFQALTDATLEAVLIIDEGIIVETNRAYAKIFGYESQEILGESALKVVAPESIETVWNNISSGYAEPYEAVGVDKDGTRFDMEVHGRAFSYKNRPVRVTAIRDITERKKNERALRTAEKQYRTLVEQIPAVVYISSLDSSRPSLYTSPQALSLTGYSPEEWSSDRDLFGKALHPRDRKRVLKEHSRANSTGSPLEIEYRLVTRDGRVVWVWEGSVVVRDDTDPVSYRQGILVDTTDKKQAEESLRRSESRHAAVVDTAFDAIITMDTDGNVASFNQGARQIFGYKEEEIVGQPLTKLLPGEYREGYRVGMERYLRTGEAHFPGQRVSELEGRRKDGGIFPLEISVAEMRDGGEVLLTGIIRDISERKEAERKLRESEKRFRSLVQNSSDIITILDADGVIRYQSPSAERILGYRPGELAGEQLFDYIHPEDAVGALRAFAGALRNPETETVAELRARHTDGSWRWLEGVAVNLLDDQSVQGVVLNSRDVTERKALEEKLSYQAFYDPLTGLPNRNLLTEHLRQALSGAKRRENVVAVLFIDLDNFKVINDSLGHEAGDRLLVAVSERLRACVRPEDVVARFGGDEFAVLVENLCDRAGAIQVAERVETELEREAFTFGEYETFVSASIGIALSGPRAESPEDLLRNADAAMYEAKVKGKSCHAVFNPAMKDRAVQRLSLENGLRRALERDEFVVYYQPTVLLESGQVCGFEALVRWRHPERGMVSPADFIPLAEETGLILPLGRRVLEKACLQARDWRGRFPLEPAQGINVNLSASQFRDPQLVESVADSLRETGLPPGSLTLEITESVLVEDTRRTDKTLADLKTLGVKLAMDDFGKGHSSLAYLKRLPVDYLKIDRSLVSGLEKDRGNAAIVSAAVSLARAFDLRVVAEGIETENEALEVSALECDIGQGFYWCRPQPAEEIEKLFSGTGALTP